MMFYGGKITKHIVLEHEPNVEDYYWLLNFNDFPMSIVTLFHIMVVNNWFITTDMYCEVMGSRLPIFFFVSFWVLSVLILLNIVTASIIEIYSGSEEVISVMSRFLDNTKFLKKKFEGKSEEEIIICLDYAIKLLE